MIKLLCHRLAHLKQTKQFGFHSHENKNLLNDFDAYEDAGLDEMFPLIFISKDSK